MKGSPAAKSALKSKSPAEFFAENKNIAGFDNPGKSLYTTLRELIENGLDAAEAVPTLPEISVKIEEMSLGDYHRLIGLEKRERVDLELFQEAGPKKKAAAGKGKAKGKAEEGALGEADGAGGLAAAAEAEAAKGGEGKGPKGPKERTFYRVTVKDNGIGMAHHDIPEMLGRVLSGTKYGLKQTRGKFGLGSKMALLWSKMSTNLPFEIRSVRKAGEPVSYCKLDIDIRRNQPNILAHEKLPNSDKWRGTEISIVVEGNWTTYKARILLYMRLMAVITPYARFELKFSSTAAPDKSFGMRYARRTDQMPPPAKEVKPHPSAVNLITIKHLVQETRHEGLEKFLMNEFSSINKAFAQRLIAELGEDFSPGMPVRSISDKQLVRLHSLFHQVSFDKVSGDCLSPAGEYNLRLGVMQQLKPDMVATWEEPARVHEGHPFIVEAAVALGGKAVKPGITVFRFANRIPLLFEQGADVATRTANKSVNWAAYKIRAKEDKIGVFVSIVSTKVPFKGTGKEYIGDDIDEIKAAVKSAIMNCCLQLKAKIVRAAAQRERAERKRNLTRYIPDVSRALFGVLESMADSEPQRKRARAWPEAGEVLGKVAAGEVTEAGLAQRLTQHVELVDSAQALDAVARDGLSHAQRAEVFLAPLEASPAARPYLAAFEGPHASFRALALTQP
eukprot:tig00021127_g18855.t1